MVPPGPSVRLDSASPRARSPPDWPSVTLDREASDSGSGSLSVSVTLSHARPVQSVDSSHSSPSRSPADLEIPSCNTSRPPSPSASPPGPGPFAYPAASSVSGPLLVHPRSPKNSTGALSPRARDSEAAGCEGAASFRVYRARWLVLLVFSLEALLSNALCYQYAPVSHLAEQFFSDRGAHLSWTINVFFITYIPLTFPCSRLLESLGLKGCVLIGAALHALGACLRCVPARSGGGGDFTVMMVGQVVISLAQCFFVNSPPLLSALWFSESERTMATTVSVNANTLGIAAAYLLGPFVARDVEGVRDLNQLMAAISCGLLLLCAVLPSAPPSAPSRSAHLKQVSSLAARPPGWQLVPSSEAHPELPQPEGPEHPDQFDTPRALRPELAAPGPPSSLRAVAREIAEMVRAKGFVHALMLFAMSEATINVYSTFLNYMLEPLGVPSAVVASMGVLFIVSCLVGSAVFGFAVDRTRRYYAALLLCMVGCAAAQLAFAVVTRCCETPSIGALVAVVGLVGVFVGPVQPISLETAAECTYPIGEASVAAVQQLLGNIFSAVLVPVLTALQDEESKDMSRGNWLLLGCLAACTLFFSCFNGQYRRLGVDKGEHAQGVELT